MSKSPFALFATPDNRTFAVHHSAVVCVEEAKNGGSYIMLRAGNSTQSFQLSTPYLEVLELLNKARLEELSSFGP